MSVWLFLILIVSLQAVIGTAWSRLIGGSPRLELTCFAGALGGVIGWLRRRPHDPSDGGWKVLGLVLLLGLVIRLIHPLSTYALGQSDAYSHLQFFRDIVQRGVLRNPVYPPGYHWVAALPALILPIDPYFIARYVGAFFGLLMILGVYVSGLQMTGRRQAWMSALLVAAFPGAWWLIKTGIGAFANQLGLALVPALLWSYLRLRKGNREAGPVFAAVLLGLAVSTPILLLDVLPILLLDVLCGGWRQLKSRRAVAVGAAWGVLMLTGALVFARLPFEHLDATATMLIGHSEPVQSAPDVAGRLVGDYFKLKHAGWGNGVVNTALIGMGLFFVLLLFAAFRSSNRALRVWVIAGLFTLWQTATGMFQFSAYQRAGWMFLMTACVAGGYVFAFIADRLPVSGRRALAGLAVAVCLLPLWKPPVHSFHMSPAESALIRTVRALKQYTGPKAGRGGNKEGRQLVSELDPGDSFVVVTRPFTAFPGGQGDPIRALLENTPHIELRTFNDGDTLHPPTDRVMLVLIDGAFDEKDAHALPMPGADQPFIRSRNELLRINTELKEAVHQLSAGQWDIQPFTLDNLRIYRIAGRSQLDNKVSQ